jgi:hypothetical protein
MGLSGYDAPLLPIPDGTLSQGDRFHLLDLYSGIGGGAPPTFLAAWAARVNTILGAGARGL